MAKQVLIGACQLMLPEWRRDFWQCDIGGERHGFLDHSPRRVWGYHSAREEVWHGGIRPDVLLSDSGAVASLPLLVEVKVSHAVDEPKARLVREQGWAMVEIDLSKIPEEALAYGRFSNFVLVDAPRKWVHAPKAEQRYAEKRATVLATIEAVNKKLRARGLKERDQFGRTDADRKREREFDALRRSRRQPFLVDLKALAGAVQTEVLRQQEAERRTMEADQISRLVTRHGGEIPHFARTSHRDAWAVSASSARWQMELAERFVFDGREGTRLASGVLSRWVEDTYGIDEAAARLIQAQRNDRERRKRRGDTAPQAMLRHAWFFDSWENEAIPNIFRAVEQLMGELVKAGYLLKTKRWTYAVVGPKDREERRLAQQRREAELVEDQRRVFEAMAERERLVRLRLVTNDQQLAKRTEALVAAYHAIAERYDQCLDCVECRWPSPPEAGSCENCRSTNVLLIRLDANRLREVPFRLRSDPCVTMCARYPFEPLLAPGADDAVRN